MIEEKDGEWCLYSKTKGKGGKRKSLGCYGSRAGAEKREKQVNMFKHMKKEASNMTSIQAIIAEEVEIILKESNDREVLGALDKLIQEIPAAIPELEKVVTSNILPYISSTLGGSLKEAEGDDPRIEKAAATAKGVASTAGYVLSHLPMGKKMGVMIATALDKTTEDHVRNAVFFALGNLIAGQLGLDLPDLGDLMQEIPETMWEMLPFTDNDQEWDWGILNAVDDSLLLTWAWLKVKNAVDVEEKLHEFGKFIGRSNLGKQPEVAPEGPPPGEPGERRPPRQGPAAAWRKAQRAKERGEEELQEMKIKTSQLYKIIQEELEVVLTNEEAVEIFDLDMTALLDEMMEEGLPFMKDVERARQGKIPPAQAAKIKAASTAMQTRAGDPSRTSQGPGEEEEDLTKPIEVSEMTTVSTDDLYLAEMFDTGSDTKESCAAKGGQWNEASQKCEFLEEAEDKSFSKAAKEIEKKGTEGVFTAKAKKAGMGVQAYAAKVLKKGSKASTKTKRQAAFAKGAATVARENK